MDCPTPGPAPSLRGLLAAVLVCALPWLVPALRAEEPAAPSAKIPSASAEMAPRDVLRRAIEPTVNLFTSEPPGTARALSVQLRLLDANDQPPELRGARLHVYCQPPDKLLLQFFALGNVTTVSRQGQSVWVTPASRLAPILERTKGMQASSEQQEPLATLRLPIPVKLFWLFFRFVTVRDGGEAILNGQVCRKLEIDAREKEDKGKFVRLWVRADTFKLVRMDWQGPKDHVNLAVDEFDLVPSLPAGVFQPDANAKADLLDVPVKQFRTFLTLLGKEEEKRKKALHNAAGATP